VPTAQPPTRTVGLASFALQVIDVVQALTLKPAIRRVQLGVQPKHATVATDATTATAISVFLVVVAVVPQATQNSVRQQALDTNGVSPKPVTVPTDATMVTATNVLQEAVAAQVQLNKFAN
jgi:hypothetical protein